jgi:hypothetical protein
VELTLVDKLQLGDDVEPNLGELILQHLEEHGKKMVDSPRAEVNIILLG